VRREKEQCSGEYEAGNDAPEVYHFFPSLIIAELVLAAFLHRHPRTSQFSAIYDVMSTVVCDDERGCGVDYSDHKEATKSHVGSWTTFIHSLSTWKSPR
jgi:hypothetical protein